MQGFSNDFPNLFAQDIPVRCTCSKATAWRIENRRSQIFVEILFQR